MIEKIIASRYELSTELRSKKRGFGTLEFKPKHKK
uniref:Uncharacterized protein n=1 Tax=Podoviridae sp. ctqve24 TaxID=2826580 RepID=A0A8S5MGP6_9CAUD|nr:MAG TPA: hypothetical protein [Podoviridae sp. ctqve24]